MLETAYKLAGKVVNTGLSNGLTKSCRAVCPRIRGPAVACATIPRMSEDAPQSGGQEEPTAPIDPSAAGDAAGEEAAPEPKKKGFLPRKRSREPRAKRPREDRPKKRLFGGSPSAKADGEPAESAGEAKNAADDSTEAAAPKQEPDRPKRGLLPRRKSKADSPPPDDQPTTAFAPTEGEIDGDPEAAPRKPRRQRKKRPPREKKPRAKGVEKSDRPAPASSLRRERRSLLSSRQDAVYHLGGLAFELYRRDLLQDGVLRQRAVELGALDDRVREIDKDIGELPARRRRTAPAAPPSSVAGNCLTCRAEFAPDARFCASCGARFAPQAAESEQVTGVIDLPPEASGG